MTQTGDVVLVHIEGAPVFFARIEDISPDVKPEWYQVKMLVLQVPLVVTTWILRQPYIDGEEFTMGGRPVQLTRVVAPEEPQPESGEPEREERPPEKEARGDGGGAGAKPKVVSLSDQRKRDQS